MLWGRDTAKPDRELNGSAWLVSISGKDYGPYPEEKLRAYMLEGRVRAHTLVRQREEDGYVRIDAVPDLMIWLPHPNDPAIKLEPEPEPAPAKPAPRKIRVTPVSEGARSQTLASFVVAADVPAEADNLVMLVLSRLGRAEDVAPGVWLLRAGLAVDAVRNALARALDGAGPFLVVDCANDRAAWHNVEPARDKALRALRREA